VPDRPIQFRELDVVGSVFAYFRWRDAPRLCYSKYSEAQLVTFAAAATRAKGTDTWCVFDNTARHAARDDALQFVAALTAGAA